MKVFVRKKDGGLERYKSTLKPQMETQNKCILCELFSNVHFLVEITCLVPLCRCLKRIYTMK